MYRIELSTDIAAPVERVWRALCDPGEVVAWDSGVSAALDAPDDYPQVGQHVRWRYRSRLFRLLHDQPQEVVRQERLRSLLDLGPFHMDETYMLTLTDTGCRVDLRVDLEVRMPLLGALVEGLYAGPETRRGFESSLAGLKRYCETRPA